MTPGLQPRASGFPRRNPSIRCASPSRVHPLTSPHPNSLSRWALR
jgi:hypothetical protein